MLATDSASVIRLSAPGKLNLFLELLGKRPDGFHEIDTLIVRLDLADSVFLTARNDGQLQLDCRWSTGREAQRRFDSMRGSDHRVWSELPAAHDNLAYRVLARLQESGKVSLGATVRIEKRIPAEAGLGGASSDAAAVLMAANRAWRLDWSRERLASLAAGFGSDIPFFFFGAAARCRGRGEQVTPLPTAPLHVVVVKPKFGLSTAAVYARAAVADSPHSPDAAIAALALGDPQRLAEAMTNRLQTPAAAQAAAIHQLLDRLRRAGAIHSQLTGSGACCFGLFANARSAHAAAARLQGENWGSAFAATTEGGFANQHQGTTPWKSPRFASS